mmetsp:Transcript_64700/g.108475  ORF Transcript_64700/g.108475 Transcript_64700/m.108475 type:complete len:635 (+) Transcript_64700:958-2862(+)
MFRPSIAMLYPQNITPSSGQGALSTSTLYDCSRSIKFPVRQRARPRRSSGVRPGPRLRARLRAGPRVRGDRRSGGGARPRDRRRPRERRRPRQRQRPRPRQRPRRRLALAPATDHHRDDHGRRHHRHGRCRHHRRPGHQPRPAGAGGERPQARAERDARDHGPGGPQVPDTAHKRLGNPRLVHRREAVQPRVPVRALEEVGVARAGDVLQGVHVGLRVQPQPAAGRRVGAAATLGHRGRRGAVDGEKNAVVALHAIPLLRAEEGTVVLFLGARHRVIHGFVVLLRIQGARVQRRVGGGRGTTDRPARAGDVPDSNTQVVLVRNGGGQVILVQNGGGPHRAGHLVPLPAVLAPLHLPLMGLEQQPIRELQVVGPDHGAVGGEVPRVEGVEVEHLLRTHVPHVPAVLLVLALHEGQEEDVAGQQELLLARVLREPLQVRPGRQESLAVDHVPPALDREDGGAPEIGTGRHRRVLRGAEESGVRQDDVGRPHAAVRRVLLAPPRVHPPAHAPEHPVREVPLCELPHGHVDGVLRDREAAAVGPERFVQRLVPGARVQPHADHLRPPQAGPARDGPVDEVVHRQALVALVPQGVPPVVVREAPGLLAVGDRADHVVPVDSELLHRGPLEFHLRLQPVR